MNDLFRNLKPVIKKFRSCDIILVNGNDCLVGISYFGIFSGPILRCKYSGPYTYVLSKIAAGFYVPCIEKKNLAKSIFDKVETDMMLPEIFYKVLAKLYAVVYKERGSHKNMKERYYDGLNFEVLQHFFDVEDKCYKKIKVEDQLNVLRTKQFREKLVNNFKRVNPDELTVIEDEINLIAKKYSLIEKDYHKTVFYDLELSLETEPDEYKMKFIQLLFVSQKEKKITVASRYFYIDFGFDEIELLILFIDYVAATVNACSQKIKQMKNLHYDEFKISPEEYEMIGDSIKRLLEYSCRKKGYVYCFDKKKKTNISFFLYEQNEKDGGTKKYTIEITPKAFSRNPTQFYEFLLVPKRRKDWNFKCKESNLRKDLEQIKRECRFAKFFLGRETNL